MTISKTSPRMHTTNPITPTTPENTTSRKVKKIALTTFIVLSSFLFLPVKIAASISVLTIGFVYFRSILNILSGLFTVDPFKAGDCRPEAPVLWHGDSPLRTSAEWTNNTSRRPNITREPVGRRGSSFFRESQAPYLSPTKRPRTSDLGGSYSPRGREPVGIRNTTRYVPSKPYRTHRTIRRTNGRNYMSSPPNLPGNFGFTQQQPQREPIEHEIPGSRNK